MELSEHEDDLMIPQALVTPLMWVGFAALVASFVISLQSSSSVNGQVVEFKDFGALIGGGVAAGIALLAIKGSFDPMAPQHKTVRLVLSVLLLLGGLYRVAYGAGFLI